MKKCDISVSVVVIAYNEEDVIGECLDSLMALDFPKETYEIIVVDNNSTDRSKEIIMGYPVRYIFEKRRTRGCARNAGVRHARGEFIAFTDADCIVTKDWLQRLLGGFNGGDTVGICGGEIYAFSQQTVFEQYVENRQILSQRRGIYGDNAHDLPRVVTANAMFRTCAIQEAGYFDEDLLTSEDTELSWRISFLGYEIKYVPDALVHHQHTSTFRRFFKHHFDFGRAAAIVNYRYRTMHFGIEGPIVHKWRLFFYTLTQLARMLMNAIIDDIKKEKIRFLFFDTVRIASYNAGYLFSTVCLLWSRHSMHNAVSLQRFYRKLAISHNGMQWVLDCPATWFLNNDIVRLIVFGQRLDIYRFNPTATQVWLSLTRTKVFDKTVEHIADLYGVSLPQAREDTNNFVATLEKEKILKKVSTADSK